MVVGDEQPGATAKPVPVDTCALAQGSTAKASNANRANRILFKLSSYSNALEFRLVWGRGHRIVKHWPSTPPPPSFLAM